MKSFLIIERDRLFLRDAKEAMKHIYRIALKHATDLESISDSDVLKQDSAFGLLIDGQTLEQAVFDHGWQILEKYNINVVSKSLVVDLVKEVNYAHDKLEGMWLMGPTMLGVINGDDFSTWSDKRKLTQKYLDADKMFIDSSKLYVIDGLSLKSN